MSRYEYLIIAVVLGLAALALGIGIGHGLPQVYVPDTHIIRNALGMAKTQDLWPPSGLYSTYPYLLSYLLLPVYGATFFAGKALGAYASADDFGRRIVEDPTIVYMEARILIVLFGLVAVLYLYRTARRIGFSISQSSGAALLLAFNPLFVQLGHHARPWIPLVAAVTFTLYHAAGIALTGQRKSIFLSALGAGLGFAMHQVGGALILIPLAALLAGSWKKTSLEKVISAGFALLIVFACIAFFLGYGHLVFAGSSVDVIATEKGNLDLGGQKLEFDAFSGERALKTSKALFGYDPILTVLGLIGLFWGVFSNELKGVRFALLCFSGFFLAFILLYNNAHIRYILPLLPGLALGAAAAGGGMGKNAFLKKGWLLIPLVLFSGVQSGRMDILFSRTDTRDQALAWIEANIPAGTRIAAEGYTAPLLPNSESLKFLKNQAGVWLKRKELQRLEGEPSSDPRPDYFMIPLERFYRFQSYWPHQYLLNGERPIAEFMNDLGVQWIMLYDRWPREERHPPLLDYLAARAEAGPVFSPASSDTPWEATLPTDMDFPLTALWELERPGPLIRLFQVQH